MQPPDNGNDTDEDSGSEDSGGNMDNLTGRQLRAGAVATIISSDHSKTVIGDVESDESETETSKAISSQSALGTNTTGDQQIEQEQPQRRKGKRVSTSAVTRETKVKKQLSSTPEPDGAADSRVATGVAGKNEAVCSLSKETLVHKTSLNWNKKDLKPDESRISKSTKPIFPNQDTTPTSLFEYFFNDNIVDLIVTMSRRYAHQKLQPNFTITAENFRAFIAILLLLGYVPLPRRRMYWEQSTDVHNEAVAGALSLNRFEEILRYLHLADNTELDPNDKIAKIRPLFDHLNKQYLKYWPVEADLDIDESMVPYYGHHSSKQFIRGKPIRFGFKI